MKFDFIDIKYKDDLYGIWSDKETIKFTNIKEPFTYDECESRINIFLNNQLRLVDKTIFAVIENNTVCGIVGCPLIDKEQNVFGFFYQLNRNYWNKGIGYKSASMLIDYMREKYCPCVLWADVVEENTASIKILNKLGFSRVKENVNAFKRDGKLYNVIDFNMRIE